MVECVKEKLSTWKADTLSQVGRSLMIKAVIQALPTDVMSFLLLPMKIVDDLPSLSIIFCWSPAWMNERCVGVLETDYSSAKFLVAMVLKILNLLIKRRWKNMDGGSCVHLLRLFLEVFKVKYFCHDHFLRAPSASSNGSDIWKALLVRQDVLKMEDIGGLVKAQRYRSDVIVFPLRTC